MERSVIRTIHLSARCAEVIDRLLREGYVYNWSEGVRLCVIIAGQVLFEPRLREFVLEAVKGFRCPRCGGILVKITKNAWECQGCGRWWKLKQCRKRRNGP